MGDGVKEEVNDGEFVRVIEFDGESDGVCEGDRVVVRVCEGVRVGVAPKEILDVDDGVPDGVYEGVTEGLKVPEFDGVVDLVPEVVRVGDTVFDGDRELEGDAGGIKFALIGALRPMLLFESSAPQQKTLPVE